MADIKINVQNPDGTITTMEAPTDMGLSLMEFLKGNEYDILATCGGMALCATCHVEVLSGFNELHAISDDDEMRKFGAWSKLNPDWAFIKHLFEIGRAAADRFLAKQFDLIGRHSSVDIVQTYL